VLGRETFLASVEWKDGWPVLDEPDQPAAADGHSFVDDFTAPTLHHGWISPGTDPATVMHGGMLSATGLLCARVRDLRWSSEVTVEPAGGPVRFVLRLDDRHWYGLVGDRDGVTAVARIGDLEHALNRVPVTAGGAVTLRIDAVDPAGSDVMGAAVGPDEIVLSVQSADSRHELARLDGRYLSTEVASGFTGRVLGIGAVHEPAKVLRFAYTSQPS
jgi:hypothetical protein